ncbi:general secretion pathway protein GspB [Noviherbaspirillum sp. Root189]|uniref:general secretion pathway protein GspB n=1 Tax=Noviherbaspirillum sp. Root189 TaxID=1736487 RepID=UPI001F4616E4|nr:general secretion pathway protein GspB [Noviherbaspirillum sp. Root189]
MAQHLSKKIKTVTMAAIYLMATQAMNAGAQALPDPTRPPAALQKDERETENVPAAPELQSVLISPKRRVATINGQIVHVGDKVGEAQVVKITENEVVLRNGKESRTLKLLPQVQRRSGQDRNSSRTGSGPQ